MAKNPSDDVRMEIGRILCGWVGLNPSDVGELTLHLDAHGALWMDAKTFVHATADTDELKTVNARFVLDEEPTEE